MADFSGLTTLITGAAGGIGVEMAKAFATAGARLVLVDMVDATELARQLGVCTATIHQWGRAGLLKRHPYGNNYRCLYDPVADVITTKGAGGRYGGKPPSLMTAQSATQGVI